MLIVSCGGSADYRSILPADSFMTVSVNPASLMRKCEAGDLDQHPLYIRIKAELDKVARGEISQDELDSARRYCAQALRLAADDPVELMMYYLKMNITGEEIAPDELAALCEGVSAGEVAEIARSCELDAVYFLSGEDEEVEAE